MASFNKPKAKPVSPIIKLVVTEYACIITTVQIFPAHSRVNPYPKIKQGWKWHVASAHCSFNTKFLWQKSFSCCFKWNPKMVLILCRKRGILKFYFVQKWTLHVTKVHKWQVTIYSKHSLEYKKFSITVRGNLIFNYWNS